MLDAVEHLLLHNASRHSISTALADAFGRPPGTPIPLPTVDDYIAKVNKRWSEEAELTRVETRRRQQRRLYKRLAGLKAGGHFREAAELEKLIAKVEGNIMPIEVSGPGGGPIPVRAQPEILAAFDKLVAKPGT